VIERKDEERSQRRRISKREISKLIDSEGKELIIEGIPYRTHKKMLRNGWGALLVRY